MLFSLVTPAHGQEHAAALDWARGAYEQHQWLWRFFPSPSGTHRSFIFRRRDVDGLPRFYVVSGTSPVAPTSHWQVSSKPYAPELEVGQLLDFELRANPVVTKRDGQGRTARHDVVMEEKQRLLRDRGLKTWGEFPTDEGQTLQALVQRCGSKWLLARGERIGVSFDGSSLRADGYEQHRGKGGDLRLSTIDFSGRLTVQDPELLRAALFTGVGHGKAFGCGLLLVKRR